MAPGRKIIENDNLFVARSKRSFLYHYQVLLGLLMISWNGPLGPKQCLGYVDTSRDSLGLVGKFLHIRDALGLEEPYLGRA